MISIIFNIQNTKKKQILNREKNKILDISIQTLYCVVTWLSRFSPEIYFGHFLTVVYSNCVTSHYFHNRIPTYNV
jgi:hypothetical protein